MRLAFDLNRETYEIARKTMEAKAQAMRAARSDPDWRPTPQEVVMAIFEESLARDLEGMTGEEGKRMRSLLEILYRVCPECRAKHVHTEDGLVEVSEESIARIEKVARKLEIGFDEEVVKGLENPFVTGILEAYWDAYEAVGLNVFVGDFHYLLQVWEYHHQITEAICDGDYKAGYEALVAHTDLLYQRP